MRHIREINTAVTRAIKKLAPTRTYQILPQSIQEWSLIACRTEENDKKELEQICWQQNKPREAQEELDLKQKCSKGTR